MLEPVAPADLAATRRACRRRSRRSRGSAAASCAPGRHAEDAHVEVRGARRGLRDLGAADHAARDGAVVAGLDRPSSTPLLTLEPERLPGRLAARDVVAEGVGVGARAPRRTRARSAAPRRSAGRSTAARRARPARRAGARATPTCSAAAATWARREPRRAAAVEADERVALVERDGRAVVELLDARAPRPRSRAVSRTLSAPSAAVHAFGAGADVLEQPPRRRDAGGGAVEHRRPPRRDRVEVAEGAAERDRRAGRAGRARRGGSRCRPRSSLGLDGRQVGPAARRRADRPRSGRARPGLGEDVARVASSTACGRAATSASPGARAAAGAARRRSRARPTPRRPPRAAARRRGGRRGSSCPCRRAGRGARRSPPRRARPARVGEERPQVGGLALHRGAHCAHRGRARSIRARRGRVLDLERRVVEARTRRGAARRASRRVAWQSAPGATITWAESDGKPEVDLPDVQVVHLDDAGPRGHRAADRVGVDALGRGLEEHAARAAQEAPARASISPATISEAIGSAVLEAGRAG